MYRPGIPGPANFLLATVQSRAQGGNPAHAGRQTRSVVLKSGHQIASSGLVLLSQKVAIFDIKNHVVGKIHTSARGKLRWVCQDRMTVHHGFRLMWRG